jgi:hypothetical protein
MRIYADTTALIAWFNPADEFAPAVTSWCRERAPEFCWNPLRELNCVTIFAGSPANTLPLPGRPVAPAKPRNG